MCVYIYISAFINQSLNGTSVYFYIDIYLTNTRTHIYIISENGKLLIISNNYKGYIIISNSNWGNNFQESLKFTALF